MDTEPHEFTALDGVRVYDGAAIANMDATPPEVIATAGVRLCAGETAVLHGHPGSKKTWIALCALFDALVRGYTVVALVGEGAIKSVAKRIRLLAAALAIDLVVMKDRLHVVYGPFGVAEPHAASAMRAFLLRVDARFVLLDPYVAYLGGLSENDGSAVRPLLDLLRAVMVNERNGALLIVSHNSKPTAHGGDGLRGSTVLAAWAENRSSVRLERDGSSTLVNEKVKDDEDGACFRVSLDVNDAASPVRIEPIDRPEPSGDARRTGVRAPRRASPGVERQAAIIRMLDDGNERTTRQIRDALNCSNDVAVAALTVLVENKLIVSRKKGRSALFARHVAPPESPTPAGRSTGRDTAAT